MDKKREILFGGKIMAGPQGFPRIGDTTSAKQLQGIAELVRDSAWREQPTETRLATLEAAIITVSDLFSILGMYEKCKKRTYRKRNQPPESGKETEHGTAG